MNKICLAVILIAVMISGISGYCYAIGEEYKEDGGRVQGQFMGEEGKEGRNEILRDTESSGPGSIGAAPSQGPVPIKPIPGPIVIPPSEGDDEYYERVKREIEAGIEHPRPPTEPGFWLRLLKWLTTPPSYPVYEIPPREF